MNKPSSTAADPDWQLLYEKLTEIEARLASGPAAPPEVMSDEKLAIIASSIYAARRRRLDYFDASIFGEPSWDMLLQLFASRASGRKANVTSLCRAAHVPVATGIRYLSALEKKGLIERTPAPEDRRASLIDLTPLGYRQMRRYVVDGIGRFDVPIPDER